MKTERDIKANDLKTKLSDFVSKVVPSEVGEVWLFGSRARGDSTAQSDWDVLILLNETSSDETDFNQYAYPMIEFGWRHDMELNPLIYSKSSWSGHPKNLFHHNVQKDRIRL